MKRQSADIMCQLIENTRKKYDIPANRLTRGICSRSYYSRAMSGERELDKFMADALMQRLGKSTRDFEYALDVTEYELFEERQRIRRAIGRGDCALAARLAKEYGGKGQNTATDRLHTQFGLFMRTYIMNREEAPWQEQYETAKRALAVTLPDYEEIPVTELYLSETELLLLFRMAWLTGRMGDGEAMAAQLWKLYSLMEADRYGDNEQIYIFAGVIFHLAGYPLCRGDYYTAGKMASEGLLRLRAGDSFHYAAELFRIKAMADCRSEDAARLEEGGRDNASYVYYRVFDSIMKENFPEWDGGTHYPMYYEGRVFSVGRIVKQRRRLWGMTQERLSEESFCNLATIESLEGNRRDTQMPILRRILKVLKLSSQKCYSDIITNDYGVKRDYRRLRLLAGQGRTGEALGELEKLKPKLDMAFPANRQCVEYLEYIFSCKIQGEKREESPRRLLQILNYTIPADRLSELEGVFLYEIEKEILLDLMSCYENASKKGEMLFLPEGLLEGHEEIREYGERHGRLVLTLAEKLAEAGRHKEALLLREKCLRDSVRHDLPGVLARCLPDKTWNTEQTDKENKKGDMPRYYMQAYALNMYRGNAVPDEAVRMCCRGGYPVRERFDLPESF